MKINAKSQFGLLGDEAIIRAIVNAYDETYLSDDCLEKLSNSPKYELKKEFEKIIRSIVYDNREYHVLSKTAIETAKKIQLHVDSDGFNAKFLSRIPNGTRRVYLLGEYNACYIRMNNGMLSMLGTWLIKGDDGLLYFRFWNTILDTVTGNISCGINLEFPFDVPQMLEYLQVMTFVELSELTVLNLKPGKRVKEKKEKYINESGNDMMVIVDSVWNVRGIRTEGFDVTGHLRMQPCGINREDRKLIFIEGYRKNGYVRAAGMEREAVPVNIVDNKCATA